MVKNPLTFVYQIISKPESFENYEAYKLLLVKNDGTYYPGKIDLNSKHCVSVWHDRITDYSQ
jgi:hypothetical protein